MRKIKYGMIGYGMRGSSLPMALLKHGGYELVALCDKNPERLKEFPAELKPCMSKVKLETDYLQVMANPDVEAVFITAPQMVHREMAIAAFEHGKHVYCEKPLALTVGDCQKMIDAAERSGKVFMIGQQMRYHVHLQRMSDLLASGEIGKPVMLWFKEFRNPFPSTMEWAFQKKQGGGLLLEKNCHHFDLFNWWAGAPPVSVYTSAGSDVFKKPFGYQSDIADNAYVIVDYANGVRASLQICMFMGLPADYECAIGHHLREMGAVGETGMIRTEGFDLARQIEIRRNFNREITLIKTDPTGAIPTAFNQNGNVGIYVDFADCVLNNRKPFVTGEMGKMAVAVSLAAEKSAEEKRVVRVSEIL